MKFGSGAPGREEFRRSASRQGRADDLGRGRCGRREFIGLEPGHSLDVEMLEK